MVDGNLVFLIRPKEKLLTQKFWPRNKQKSSVSKEKKPGGSLFLRKIFPQINFGLQSCGSSLSNLEQSLTFRLMSESKPVQFILEAFQVRRQPHKNRHHLLANIKLK